MAILVTGGAGYIGSHTCVELLQSGCEAVIVDSLCNSSHIAHARMQQITGRHIPLHVCDIRNTAALREVFSRYAFDAVIHFAGLKSVDESTRKPLQYYDNNITGTLSLLQVMQQFAVKKIIFSSSATVYGADNPSPYTEDMHISRSCNPYGQTKIMIEHILEDLYASDPEWSISLLRYFNPIGAHASGLIGEHPLGVPNNLCPYIAQVAMGKRPEVHVFGNDYATPDGTGIRDYIHVVDLARGHIAALRKILHSTGIDIFNLGTGRGISVLELIRAFEQVCGKPVPHSIAPRRPGDLAEAVADVSKANHMLGWKAEFGVERMCEDAWRWQRRNPDGYVS